METEEETKMKTDVEKEAETDVERDVETDTGTEGETGASRRWIGDELKYCPRRKNRGS